MACLGAILAGSLACSPPGPVPTPTNPQNRGGTLRIGVTGDAGALIEFAYSDPGKPSLGQLFRCCLARTPLTYPGLPTTDGGTALLPDLAASMPEVSRDGRSWTVRLKSGIRYAPPYADHEVTSYDLIRAAERGLRLSPDDLVFAYPFVVGVAEFARGEAQSVAGFEAPDPSTLVIRFTKPYGGFDILADAAWSPIPEALAAGHDEDLGTHWASSGPYMFETYPADPAAASIALVRNPSWDPATDERRRALVEGIEITLAGDLAPAQAALEGGAYDFLDRSAASDVVNKYRADPALGQRLRTTASETIVYLPMNLAVPPFDDIAVRRAVNAVIDRAAVRDLILGARAAQPGSGPQPSGLIVGHVFPDSLTAGLLVGYDPFASPGGRGDLARARVEMSESTYDSDGDGLCDADVCTGLQMPARDAQVGESVRISLARIGIHVEVVPLADDEANGMAYVTNRIPIQANTFAWAYTLSGSGLADLLRGGDALVAGEYEINQSLVGAAAEDLAEWGYTVTTVPAVDDLTDACDAAIGRLRLRCWADLDQLVTEAVVPWIPLFAFESAHVASARVANFSLDQSLFASFPALDQVELVPGTP